MSEGHAVQTFLSAFFHTLSSAYLWVVNTLSKGTFILWKYIRLIVRWVFRLVLPLVLLWWIIGECSDSYEFKAPNTPYSRDAAAIVNDKIDTDVLANNITYLDQGWLPEQSLWFYFATQGSNLIPYDFFLHLEQANNQNLFRSDANINALRYLPQQKSHNNPDALPVGMTKDTYAGGVLKTKKSYMGFTCAACHTSQINYIDAKDGLAKAIRIDGGPAAADMENFMVQLAHALEKTRTNPAKLARFKLALKNQKDGYYRNRPKAIDDDLNRFAVQTHAYTEINNPTWRSGDINRATHYGYARLDAFGRIFNRVIEHTVDPQTFRKALENELPIETRIKFQSKFDDIFGTNDSPKFPTPPHTVLRALMALDQHTPPQHTAAVKKALQRLRANLYNPADAPASYPYLWDVPQHDFVQWTGLVSNGGLGPMGRNAGQVIGVFGTLDWQKKTGFPWLSINGVAKLLSGSGIGSHHIDYKSSIDKRNLRRVEHQLRELLSPKWPENELGRLNTTLVQQGKPIFQRYCSSCHQNISRTDPERRIIANISKLSTIGTDPVLANNAVTANGSAGLMKGGYSDDPLGTIVLGEESPVPAILRVATQGVIFAGDPDKTFIRRGAEWTWDFFKALGNNTVKSSRRQGDYDLSTPQAPFAPITGYKARALNGIWATAPYLHNGSIPNLYEILLPKRGANDPTIDKNGNTIKYRSDTFMVGSREFDTRNVGFKKDGYPTGTGFKFDTALHGNFNTGHNYGTNGSDNLPILTEPERLALLEYLKSL